VVQVPVQARRCDRDRRYRRPLRHNTSPVASLPTDGIFFLKTDGALTVDFHVRNGGTSTTLSAIATMANDTFIELAFAYDPNANRVNVFLNGLRVASAIGTNFPSGDLMRLSMGVQNGSAVGTRLMTIDYIMGAKER